MSRKFVEGENIDAVEHVKCNEAKYRHVPRAYDGRSNAREEGCFSASRGRPQAGAALLHAPQARPSLIGNHPPAVSVRCLALQT